MLRKVLTFLGHLPSSVSAASFMCTIGCKHAQPVSQLQTPDYRQGIGTVRRVDRQRRCLKRNVVNAAHAGMQARRPPNPGASRTPPASLAARRRSRITCQVLKRAEGMLARTRAVQKVHRANRRSTPSRLPATACQPRAGGGAGTQAGLPRPVATHRITVILIPRPPCLPCFRSQATPRNHASQLASRLLVPAVEGGIVDSHGYSSSRSRRNKGSICWECSLRSDPPTP